MDVINVDSLGIIEHVFRFSSLLQTKTRDEFDSLGLKNFKWAPKRNLLKIHQKIIQICNEKSRNKNF